MKCALRVMLSLSLPEKQATQNCSTAALGSSAMDAFISDSSFSGKLLVCSSVGIEQGVLKVGGLTQKSGSWTSPKVPSIRTLDWVPGVHLFDFILFPEGGLILYNSSYTLIL